MTSKSWFGLKLADTVQEVKFEEVEQAMSLFNQHVPQFEHKMESIMLIVDKVIKPQIAQEFSDENVFEELKIQKDGLIQKQFQNTQVLKKSKTAFTLSENYPQLKLLAYSINDFSALSQPYRTGSQKICIPAAYLVLSAIVKVLEEINRDLNQMLDTRLTENQVKRFIVDYKQLCLSETHLFQAFATTDTLFYQPQTSDDWVQLKKFINQFEIKDAAKYEQSLKEIICLICGCGASLFLGLERDTTLGQVSKLAAGSAYYKITNNGEDASIQWRYQIATNLHDQQKILTVMKLRGESKALKEVFKAFLPKIAVSQRLFVPMMTKVYDLEESNTFAQMTDEEIQTQLLSQEKFL